jgi:PleD family two-component response regulator
MPEIQPSPKFRGGSINGEFPKFDQNQTRGHTSRLKDRASKGVVHVVDDDAPFQAVSGYLLTQAGYEVASYPSAEHLLDHLPKESVGCILMKVRMPGLSGLDLQERPE